MAAIVKWKINWREKYEAFALSSSCILRKLCMRNTYMYINKSILTFHMRMVSEKLKYHYTFNGNTYMIQIAVYLYFLLIRKIFNTICDSHSFFYWRWSIRTISIMFGMKIAVNVFSVVISVWSTKSLKWQLKKKTLGHPYHDLITSICFLYFLIV